MSQPLRIIYAGTPEFSAAALAALLTRPCAVEVEVVAVYTQPDRPAGRGRKLQYSPVKTLALEHDIPVYQPVTLRDGAALQQFEQLAADLMVVAAYGLLLPATILAAPRLGCINIHASLLPRWRGAAPIQRAILAGDEKTGITIMQMDEGLDTGDMLAVAECEIAADETGASLHDKLMMLGADTLIESLPAIAAGTTEPVKQDEKDACYADKLSKAEAHIDWTRPAVDIERAVRAFNSWPVAFCRYQRDASQAEQRSQLRIWRAGVHPGDCDAEAGQVIAESVDGIDVATGAGILRIHELQPEGKRRMAVADFLNASSLLGQVLS